MPKNPRGKVAALIAAFIVGLVFISYIALSKARPVEDLVENSPWAGARRSESYIQLGNRKTVSTEWQLGDADPLEVLKHFKSRYPSAQWKFRQSQGMQIWSAEIARTGGGGVGPKRLMISKFGNETSVLTNKEFDPLDFALALVRTGGKARLQRPSTTGQPNYTIWPF